MSTVEASLGNRREVCRQLPAPEANRGVSQRLGPFSNDPEEPAGILELSLEAERDFVIAELETQLEEGKQRIHKRFRLRDEARRLLPEERVAKCSKNRIDGKQPISLMRSADSGLGFFSNVQRCGSVWGCPVCAAKITEKKRIELSQALIQAKQQGLLVYLLSLTVPHHYGQDTRQLCDAFLKAYKTMQNRTPWRNWRERMGLIGTVRALEVTYGWTNEHGQPVYNGAHVHLHVLVFLKPCTWLARYKKPAASDLLPAWQSACKDSGLPEPNEHGLDIQFGDYAASYVAKWGLEHEMTKAHVKTGRGSGRTASDLLGESSEGDCVAGQLFQEHYFAFKGRRQLVWSKGLRDLLGLGAEKEDKELADEMTEPAVCVCVFTERQWSLIRFYGAPVEADLCLAARDGPDNVQAYLARLERFHGR